MSSVETNCPACGGPIAFKMGSSIVVVCEYCHSVVARGDRKLEDLGKVAAIVETDSPLEIGLRGSYQGVGFEIMGRAQLGHQAGGRWDEWYAAFNDGRWGWIAEAQGRFYVTFQASTSEATTVPPFDELELGQSFVSASGPVSLVVAEKGVARYLAAKGEIPYRLDPNETYAYADLSGPQGEFATIDYSEESPLLFIGREIPLPELGVRGKPATAEPKRVAAAHVSCPNCGGALELRAPDQTERVTCPNCGSLLDVNQGNLRFLKALQKGKVKPIIPIGSEGQISDRKYIVIGFMQRSVEFEGVKYYWEEYLLYHPEVGFRWLTRSDDHWNLVQSASAGQVVPSGRNVRFGDKTFKLYQDAIGQVEYVEGEFYWKVEVGEKAMMADFVRPPFILSKETSVMNVPPPEEPETPPARKQKKKKQEKVVPVGEINWSLGVYFPREDVEAAFGIKGLPVSSKVAPNQVFPHKEIYRYWGWMALATLVVGLGLFLMIPTHEVFQKFYPLPPATSVNKPQVGFSDPFQLQARKNIEISMSSNVQNTWMYVEGDLINEETGLVQTFSVPIEYYSGVEGGESWSEGDPSPAVHLSALPAGRYTLRLEIQREKWQLPANLSVKIEQGVPRLLHLMLALLAVSVIPLLVAWRHFNFEKRRWEDSDYSPYESD